MPAHFPYDVVNVKRSTLRTVDDAAFERKASSEGEIVVSSFATFLQHLPDSGVCKENVFERLRG